MAERRPESAADPRADERLLTLEREMGEGRPLLLGLSVALARLEEKLDRLRDDLREHMRAEEEQRRADAADRTAATQHGLTRLQVAAGALGIAVSALLGLVGLMVNMLRATQGG